MIQLFSLVLEPWENRKLYLRRQLNMDDLLRKLKWHAFLLRPVIEHDRQPEEVKNLPARLKDFEGRVDKLLAERDIKMDIDLNSGRMPVIPIMDLVMGVCFDSRPWTTAGRSLNHTR